MHYVVTMTGEDGFGGHDGEPVGVFHRAEDAIARVQWRAELGYRRFRAEALDASQAERDRAWENEVSRYRLYELRSGYVLDGSTLLGQGLGVFIPPAGLDARIDAGEAQQPAS